MTLTHGSILKLDIELPTTREARKTVSGYVEVLLATSGVMDTAKNPLTDGLFEAKDTPILRQKTRVRIHSRTDALIRDLQHDCSGIPCHTSI